MAKRVLVSSLALALALTGLVCRRACAEEKAAPSAATEYAQALQAAQAEWQKEIAAATEDLNVALKDVSDGLAPMRLERPVEDFVNQEYGKLMDACQHIRFCWHLSGFLCEREFARAAWGKAVKRAVELLPTIREWQKVLVVDFVARQIVPAQRAARAGWRARVRYADEHYAVARQAAREKYEAARR